MNVSVSGSVSSIKEVTVATTGTGEPNWSYIPSAGKSNNDSFFYSWSIRKKRLSI